MAPRKQVIKVHIERHNSIMEYELSDHPTSAHLMQAVPEHFLNVDIRALRVLSDAGWEVEVTQLDPPRIEALPTASHKKKHRDNYLDKGGKGNDGGERRVWKWGGGRLQLIEEGGKGEEGRVKVKTEEEQGGERGGGRGKEKKVVKAEEKQGGERGDGRGKEKKVVKTEEEQGGERGNGRGKEKKVVKVEPEEVIILDSD
ncbi:hypothetical protein HK104_006352 [Borealophlyctis nickersoniae]|nr:hypothetical protein HK104_006352 [Borealophlyctis nickersoniae]